ncbi:MAG: HAMP domain-containing histidine kinase, partial [Motiliproteus sp.]|nr:HAMP domain-containing histidine kinase [Motiliproteus sp.]
SLVHGVEKGGEIKLTADSADGGVNFCFRDDGRGMTAEQLEKAFDPFYSTQLGQGSSGLGLYRVHNLVTVVCGGRIELASELGQGVVVNFWLPATL